MRPLVGSRVTARALQTRRVVARPATRSYSRSHPQPPRSRRGLINAASRRLIAPSTAWICSYRLFSSESGAPAPLTAPEAHHFRTLYLKERIHSNRSHLSEETDRELSHHVLTESWNEECHQRPSACRWHWRQSLRLASGIGHRRCRQTPPQSVAGRASGQLSFPSRSAGQRGHLQRRATSGYLGHRARRQSARVAAATGAEAAAGWAGTAVSVCSASSAPPARARSRYLLKRRTKRTKTCQLSCHGRRLRTG